MKCKWIESGFELISFHLLKYPTRLLSASLQNLPDISDWTTTRAGSPRIENDSTFVAPKGVYSIIEEHRVSTFNPHALISQPTKLWTILIRYPAHNRASGSQALAPLPGGGKEKDAKKDKAKADDAGKDKDNHLEPPAREREDGISLSSNDSQGDAGNGSQDLPAGSPPVPEASNTPAHACLNIIFSHSPPNTTGSKKKASSRPKYSIRATSSTFISRIQTAERPGKHLQSRQGKAAYVFYNHPKSSVWTEVGSKVKVCMSCLAHYHLRGN